MLWQLLQHGIFSPSSYAFFLFGPPIRWCFASTGLPQNRQYSLYSVIIPFFIFHLRIQLFGWYNLLAWFLILSKAPVLQSHTRALFFFIWFQKQPVLSAMLLNGRYYLYLFLRSSAIIADTSFSRIQKAATFAAFIPLPHLHACQMLQSMERSAIASMIQQRYFQSSHASFAPWKSRL